MLRDSLLVIHIYRSLPTRGGGFNKLKIDDGNGSYRVMKTATVSHSQSASATFLTSAVDSAGLSNITALTKSSTSATLTRSSTSATLTKESTSAWSGYSTVLTRVALKLYYTCDNNSYQTLSNSCELKGTAFWSYIRQQGGIRTTISQTAQIPANGSINISVITYLNRVEYEYGATLNRNNLYSSYQYMSTYSAYSYITKSNYYTSANSNGMSGATALTKSSISGYGTRSSISGYGTSETTIGYSGISSSSSSESVSTTSWI